MATTQPLDIVTKALNAIGVGAAGEPLESSTANDAFDFLNMMLDQWSNEKQMLYCVQEVILELTGNQYIYTIGPGGMVGAVFTGSISGTTLTVTALTSGAISVGQTLSGTGITAGTAITSLGTALGGNGVNALGTYSVNLSQTVGSATTTGVASVAVVSPGAVFAAVPTVAFAGGGGAGAAAFATMAATSIGVGAAGSGYTAGDIVSLVGGTFTSPVRVQILAIGGGGVVSNALLIDGGNYSALPASPAATTGGTGTGFTVTTAGQWIVHAITVTAAGSGYTSVPTVTVQAIASFVQATATAILQTPATAGVTITSSAVRPLRINSAIVRIVNSASGTLDYPVDVIALEDYELIGIKTLPGPWPRAVYYQPSEPVGVLNFWPNPSSGEVHLFCDTVLNQFASLSDTVYLPQGYKMALIWCLADYLIPFYPATGNAAETRAKVPAFAKRGRDLIARTNMQPQQTMRVDSAISSRRGRDAGWILHGGFVR